MELDFLRASSYVGASTTSEEAVSLGLVSKIPVEGRHVLVVEDIIDTGLTLQVRLPADRPLSTCAECCLLTSVPLLLAPAVCMQAPITWAW
jgi:hypoxanthine phosphoribosyltransferase